MFQNEEKDRVIRISEKKTAGKQTVRSKEKADEDNQWRKQVMKVKKEQGRAEEDGNGRRWNKKTGGCKEERGKREEGQIGEGLEERV
jgi:hypothetical protein